MLKDAGQLCKATDALLFCVLKGGQDRTITPACSLLHTCKSFSRQKRVEQTQQLTRLLLPLSLIREQRHHLPLPIVSLLWAQLEMDQAQQPSCAWHKHSPHHRLAQVTWGQRLCVKVAVLLLETALHPKAGSSAEGSH